MWTPEQMDHFLFATTKDDLTEILEFFGKEGKFHVVDFSHKKLDEPTYTETFEKLQEQQEKINNIIDYFDIETEKELAVHAVDATVVQKKAEEFLSDFEEELGEKQERLKELKEKEDGLNITSELLTLIPEGENSVEDLREGKFFRMTGGVIPPDEKKNLQDIMEGTENFVFTRPVFQGSVPVIIFYPADNEEQVKKIKEEVRFSTVEEFEKLSGPLDELKNTIEVNFWEIKEERARIRATIKEMGEDAEENILKMRRDIETSIREMKWVNKMSRTENIFFIDAYIPSKIRGEIHEKIDLHELFILEEEAVKRDSPRAEKTPTKLGNLFLFKPFEFLVTTYAPPSYRGIDPTILTTLTFLLMYGIMFSDIGHGLILLLGGITIYFLKPLRKYTLLPVTIGISSIIFGVLFGEFFGTHPFEPIWFSPLETPEKAMIFAVYLGMGFVSAGFVIKIIESIMKKDTEELFLTGDGLPGLIFYGSLIALAFSVFKDIPEEYIITEGAITAASVLVIALGKPLKQAVREGINTDELLISMGELLHLSLAMISNTLSFIRVAAFNLGHIILTVSIITIAEMLGETFGAGKYSTLIFGNLFIILLEGMIVFIQSLRLEYYEFYSRFFEKGNTMYEPMKI